MLKHHVQWVTASPLWKTLASEPSRMQRPALLRFTADTFMEDLAALLDRDPDQLPTLIAQPESYAERPLGASRRAPGPARLKLYQPVHGHFNLVGASLVCRAPGLPDRAVKTTPAEQVGFVLRRVSGTGELAWAAAANGMQWTTAQPFRLAPAEEVLPLFPVNFADGRDRRRRVHVGLIPTASRETYDSPSAFPAASDPALLAEQTRLDPRIEELENRVLAPLESLVQLVYPIDPAATQEQADEALAQQPLQQQETSRFILLDLADFLNHNLVAVWNALENARPGPLSRPRRELYDLLAGSLIGGSTSWSTALRRAFTERDQILEVSPGATTVNFNLRSPGLTVADLRNKLRAAILDTPAPTPSEGKPEIPKIDGRDATRYLIRCVYQQPQCGALHPELLSEPSEDFAIAPYYDVDAPSRLVRIVLPDTSIAGLRKFKKNVAFVLAPELRKQMSRVTKDIFAGKAGGGQGFELGEICSFSIPIITICAFIVLMIFLILLNIVFWWLPFLKICLPIPRR